MVTLDGRRAGLAPRSFADGWIFAGGVRAIDTVRAGGRRVVEDGRRVARDGIARRYEATISRLCGVCSRAMNDCGLGPTGPGAVGFGRCAKGSRTADSIGPGRPNSQP